MTDDLTVSKKPRAERQTFPAKLYFVDDYGKTIGCKYAGYPEFEVTREEWNNLPVWRKDFMTDSEIENHE